MLSGLTAATIDLPNYLIKTTLLPIFGECWPQVKGLLLVPGVMDSDSVEILCEYVERSFKALGAELVPLFSEIQSTLLESFMISN